MKSFVVQQLRDRKQVSIRITMDTTFKKPLDVRLGDVLVVTPAVGDWKRELLCKARLRITRLVLQWNQRGEVQS